MDNLKIQKENLLVKGDTGIRKTERVIFPLIGDIINNGESFLSFDTKNECYETFYDVLKEKDYNIIVLNFRDAEKSDGWNPLDRAYSEYKEGNRDNAFELLEQVSKVIFPGEETADPFWVNTARDYFTGVCLALFDDAKKNEINLNSVNVFTTVGEENSVGKKTYVDEYFNAKESSSLAYISASSTIIAPPDTKGSILSIFKQKLRLFVSKEGLNRLLSETTFNYKDINEKPTAIFIKSKTTYEVFNKLSALFIGQLYNYLENVHTQRKFNFVLDNFNALPLIPNLIDMLVEAKSSNMRFIISTNEIGILENNYTNYINKLLEPICVTINEILIDGKNISYNPIDIKISNNINFPILPIKTVECFDLKKKIKTLRDERIQQLIQDGLSESRKIDIEELVSKIDNRIEQLELLEKEQK